jgi:hypothetical protein
VAKAIGQDKKYVFPDCFLKKTNGDRRGTSGDRRGRGSKT